MAACPVIRYFASVSGRFRSQLTRPERTKKAKMAVVVGTWSFSMDAVKLISDKLRKGSDCVDALESGVNGWYCPWRLFFNFNIEDTLSVIMFFVILLLCIQ